MPTKSQYLTDLDTPYWWEVVYENGDFSVLSEMPATQALIGISEHHHRAKNGLAGGPPDNNGRTVPAIRIKRMLAYTKHPGDVQLSLTPDEWVERIKAASKNKPSLTIDELDLQIAPYALKESSAHETNYVMDEVGELDPALWEGDN